MKVILDTNVFVSGIFFAGPPYRVLQAWKQGHIQLVISPTILAEYREVGLRLAQDYPQIDILPFVDLVMVHADIVQADVLPNPICEDPDDDMFLACALASLTQIIISGDKHLLKLNGFEGIEILKPKSFLDLYLEP